MTSSMRAASSTVRVMGPISSCVGLNGMMPSRLISRCVGRTPTKSVLRPATESTARCRCRSRIPAKLAAIAAPVPPLEPPGVRDRSYGFSVCPPSELTVVPVSASSVRFVLPMIIGAGGLQPPHDERVIGGESTLSSVTDPPVVGRSAVSKLSLSTSGTHCRGPQRLTGGARAIHVLRRVTTPAD